MSSAGVQGFAFHIEATEDPIGPAAYGGHGARDDRRARLRQTVVHARADREGARAATPATDDRHRSRRWRGPLNRRSAPMYVVNVSLARD